MVDDCVRRCWDYERGDCRNKSCFQSLFLILFRSSSRIAQTSFGRTSRGRGKNLSEETIASVSSGQNFQHFDPLWGLEAHPALGEGNSRAEFRFGKWIQQQQQQQHQQHQRGEYAASQPSSASEPESPTQFQSRRNFLSSIHRRARRESTVSH